MYFWHFEHHKQSTIWFFISEKADISMADLSETT